MVYYAALRACSNRSCTRAAPISISTNSDSDIEKNGTLASPVTAHASSVLPVPVADQQDAPGQPCAGGGHRTLNCARLDDGGDGVPDENMSLAIIQFHVQSISLATAQRVPTWAFSTDAV